MLDIRKESSSSTNTSTVLYLQRRTCILANYQTCRCQSPSALSSTHHLSNRSGTYRPHYTRGAPPAEPPTKPPQRPGRTGKIPAIQVRSGSAFQFSFLDRAPRLRRPESAARLMRKRMIKSECAWLSSPTTLVCAMRGAIQLHDAARFCRRDGTLDPRIAAVQREGDL